MSDKNNKDSFRELESAEEELGRLRKKVAALRKQLIPEEIEDYDFINADGNIVRLSDLFGDKNDLIVIHNMGRKCPYCTLWADGFNGIYQHLENRAAFVVISHDSPETMKVFAESRNWKFRILSNDGGPFTRDMGYEDESGSPQPGISTFHRNENGMVHRISHTSFGPGDDFCAVWHILDMLKDSAAGWAPKFNY